MYFLYVDESGNSGLHDPDQPFHILGGLAVEESQWRNMAADLDARIEAIMPSPRPATWELHMAEMWSGNKLFKGVLPAVRLALRDAVMEVVEAHAPTLFFMVVDKQAHIASTRGRTRPRKSSIDS